MGRSLVTHLQPVSTYLPRAVWVPIVSMCRADMLRPMDDMSRSELKRLDLLWEKEKKTPAVMFRKGR